ncbi:hypothetical protein FA95DRAFT_1613785 [Auriscalpium vulgare]|uniref:Uncharacterized protein n=1 Tax=Auriscalpium vulgare TaxID=40419 RepID=A0ACB8R2R1_9AGAM|nr:hypothetical protein FA95DRAFT_1613785 [Auriscalpium vulgare]
MSLEELCSLSRSELESFWADTVRTRLVQLRAVSSHAPRATVHNNADMLYTAQNALEVTISSLHARHCAEIAAMKSALEAISEAYDKEVNYLRGVQRELREQHNHWLPIMCLPPEVLTAIFELLAIADPPGGPRPSRPRKLGWISVSHVCSRWRDIAINCPSLWARLTFSVGAKCLQVMHSLAKSAPLHFSTGNTQVLADIHSTFIAENLHQTKSISVTVNPSQYETFRYLVKPAPLLESLAVKVTGTNMDPSTASRYHSRLFPTDLLGGCAPNLRYCTFDTPECLRWTSPLLVNLVSLEVTQTKMEATPRQHVKLREVKHALQNMKALQRLTLDVALRGLHPPSDGDTVFLPHLDLLSITAPRFAVRRLLEHLTIPPAAQLLLTLDLPFTSCSKKMAALSLAISSCRGPGGSHSTRMDSFYQRAGRAGTQNKWSTFCVEIWDVDGDRCKTSVSLCPRKKDIRPSRGARANVLTSWVTEHLEIMGIGNLGISPADFEASLRAAKRLRILKIYSKTALALLLAVPSSSTLPDDNPPPGPILPMLSTLIISGVGFSGGTAAGQTYGESLALWLTHRAAAGYPLSALDLVTSSVSEQCIEALRKAAPELSIEADGKPKIEESTASEICVDVK